MRPARRLGVAALIVLLGFAAGVRAQSIGFSPLNVVVAPGERRLVAVTLSDPSPATLTALQLRLTFDPAVIRVVNPNEAYRGSVSPFAPLGGNALCETVRGQAPCPDPEWLLTLTGRTAMPGPEIVDNGAGIVQIVYGSLGPNSPAPGGGSIALVEIVGQAEGSTSVVIETSVLADASDPPAPIVHGRATLPVSVTAGTGNQPPSLAAIGPRSVAEGATLEIPLAAADPDGDALVLTASGLPPFATLTDNGDGSGAIAAAPGFFDAGTYPITASASDGQLGDDETFLLTVTNTNRPPQIVNPGDRAAAEGDAVALAMTASDPDGESLSFSATGLPPGLSIAPASGLISGTLGFDAAGTYAVQVTASDGIDVASVAFNWTVAETNRAPVLGSPGDQSSAEGDAVDLPLAASDPDGDALAFSATGLPPGLAIDPATGRIAGSLGFDSAGNYAVQVSASDGVDTVAVTFNWTVGEVNRAPTLADPGDQVSDEGDSVSLALLGDDADGDALTFAATGLPPGLGIDTASGIISGTLDFGAAGSYSVNATVSDGTDTAARLFEWTVNDVNRAPEIQSPGGQADVEGATINLAVSASDPDGDALGFTATGLPPGLAIDPASGTISGTLGFESAGDYVVRVTASDGNESASVDFPWTVAAVNRAPSLANPGSQLGNEGDAVDLALAGSDPDGDVLNYSATGLPPGLAIAATTGVIGGTLAFDAAGSYTVNATVSDGLDSAATSFDWTVNNTNRAPGLASPGNQNSSEGDTVSLALAGSDPDGDPLSYSATGLPAGLAVDAASGAIAGTLGFDTAGTYAVQASASDGEDAAVVNFDWTVSNVNRAPVVVTPPDQQNDEGDSPVLVISASDADGDALAFSATGLPPGLAIDPQSGTVAGTIGFAAAGAFTVEVTVDDGTDTVIAAFAWIVNDVNRAPTLSPPGDQTGSEGDSVNLVLVGADADGDPLSYAGSGLPPGLGIDPVTGTIAGTLGFDSAGSYAVTATVDDGQEQATVAFAWTVTDVNRAPALASPGPQVNDEGDTVSLTLAGSDADGDTLAYSASGLPPGLAIDAVSGVIGGTLPFNAAGDYSVTASAGDGTDTTSVSFGWTVANRNRAPSVVSPGNRQNDEGETVSLAIAAGDPDGDALTYTAASLPPGLSIGAASGVVGGTLPFDAEGSYGVTISVSDGELSDSTVFTWTVGGVNQPPQLGNPGDQANNEGDSVSLLLQASDADGDDLGFSATGLPTGLAIDAASGQITGVLGFDAAGSYPVRANVSDATATVSVDFTWIVADVNRAPSLTLPPARADNEGDTVNVAVTATDPDGDALTYAAANLPGGLAIDPATGVIAGTLAYDAAGNYAVLVTVDDGTDSASGSFDWSVANVNRAPTIESPGDRIDDEGSSPAVALAGSDADGDALTFSATGLPPGLAINAGTGVIAGTLSFDSAGTYAVQASVSDGTDGASVDFTWSVTDVNRPPDVASPGDRANDEGDTVSLPVTATDEDGNALAYAASGLPPGLAIDSASGLIAGSLDFASAGAYAVQLDVSDGVDTTRVEFSWTVNDVNRAPQVTPPADRADSEGDTASVQVVASDPDGDTLSFSASGMPPGVGIDPANGSIAGTLGFDAAGSYLVSVSVSDGAESSTASFSWTVADVNRPPEIAPPGDQSTDEGASVTLPILASDPDGDSLVYSATGLPPGLGIDPSSGVIDGVPGFDSAAIYNVGISASDGVDSAEVAFSWSVVDVNRAPELVSPGAQQNDEGDAVTLAVAASDPDGDPLSYSAVGLPPGLLVDSATGVISGTLGFESAGNYGVTIAANDGEVSASTTFAWTVREVNRPPSIVTPPGQSGSEGDTVSLAISASDADGDPLSYSAVGLPPGLLVDPATGVISGTLSFESAGSYTVTVTVGDGTESASATFGWTVDDTNRPPAVTSPGDQSNSEGDTVSLPVEASDADGDTLSFAANGLPGGLSIDASSGVISGVLASGSAGGYVATVSASDGTATVSASFGWQVGTGNRPPALNLPPAQTSAEGDTVSLPVSASDPDGDALVFAAAGLPAGLAIDPGSGLIAGSLGFEAAGNYQVTITVSDGNEDVSGSFSWLVSETNRAPGLAAPANQVSAEGDTVSLAVSATDPDDDPLTFAASGLPPGLSIDPDTGVIGGILGYETAGSYAVSVSASDGNDSAVGSFTWLVENRNRAPVVAPVSDQSGRIGDAVSLVLEASDPDGDALVFAAAGLPNGLSIDGSGTILGALAEPAGSYAVAVSVDDGSDSVSVSFTWLVDEAANSPPAVVNPGDRSNVAGESVSLQIVATDDDGDTLEFTAAGLPPGLAIDPATGLIQGTVPDSGAGDYAAQIDVTDGEDSVSVQFSWRIDPPGAIVTLHLPINRHPDDAEERLDTRAVIRNTPLDLGQLQDGTGQLVGLRFRDVAIPRGASIRLATLRFTAREPSTEMTILELRGEATNDADVFQEDDADLSRRAQTTAAVDWQVPAWMSAGDSGSAQTTPDISSLLQEIVDRPDWSPGQALALLVSGQGRRIAESHNSMSAAAAVLVVEYREPPPNSPPQVDNPGDRLSRSGEAVDLQILASDPDGNALTFDANGLPPGLSIDPSTGAISGTVSTADEGDYAVSVSADDGIAITSAEFDWAIRAPGSIRETVDVPIAAGRDDAEENLLTGEVKRSGPLNLGATNDGTPQLLGLRFTGIGIPSGATVQSAYLQFTTKTATGEATAVEVAGEAVAVPSRFETVNGDLTGRSTTAGRIAWTVPAWNYSGNAGAAQRSPDLAGLVQELLQQPHSRLQKDFVLLISGDGRRVAESFNSDPAAAVRLVIEYEIP